MHNLRRKRSLKHVAKVVLVLLLFLLLLASGAVLAQQVAVARRPAQRPRNPEAGCNQRRPSRHHAVALSTSAQASPSPTPDPSFVVEVYIFLGNKARDEGKLDEAESNYELARKIDNNVWRVHYGLANVLFDKALLPGRTNTVPGTHTEMNKAIEEYRTAVKLSDGIKQEEKHEVAELYSDLAQAYLHVGEDSSALTWINSALALNSASASATRRLGNYYFGKDYEKAVAQYRAALDLEPDNALTHQALGAAYNLMKKPELAIKEFEEVVRLRPGYLPGYENLASVYVANKKYNEAVGTLNKAVLLAPTSITTRYNLILAYIQKGDKASARSQFEVLKSQPGVEAAMLNSLRGQLQP